MDAACVIITPLLDEDIEHAHRTVSRPALAVRWTAAAQSLLHVAERSLCRFSKSHGSSVLRQRRFVELQTDARRSRWRDRQRSTRRQSEQRSSSYAARLRTFRLLSLLPSRFPSLSCRSWTHRPAWRLCSLSAREQRLWLPGRIAATGVGSVVTIFVFPSPSSGSLAMSVFA